VKQITELTKEAQNKFILKQYGVIPDTTIGNKTYSSTINHLINSLNNVNDNIYCSQSNTSDTTSSGRTTIETNSSRDGLTAASSFGGYQ
jgi:hypothetical protein